MKTSKKTIFNKVKLMVPLVLLTASLGACSLIGQATTSSSTTATSASKSSSSTSTTDTSSYFTDRDQDA